MKIISGGQTGVDRAALDVAMDLGLEVGGWCPKGRRAEDGRIPDRYPLVEVVAAGYAPRTYRNVLESDATLLVYRDTVTPGTAFTDRLCTDLGRPCLRVNLSSWQLCTLAYSFLREMHPVVLNIAGSRESSAPGIYEEAAAFLRALLAAKRIPKPVESDVP